MDLWTKWTCIENKREILSQSWLRQWFFLELVESSTLFCLFVFRNMLCFACIIVILNCYILFLIGYRCCFLFWFYAILFFAFSYVKGLEHLKCLSIYIFFIADKKIQKRTSIKPTYVCVFIVNCSFK